MTTTGSRWVFLFAVLLAACGGDDDGQQASPTATPAVTVAATPTTTAITPAVPTSTVTVSPSAIPETPTGSPETPTATRMSTRSPTLRAPRTPSPTPPPNQFGFSDDLLRVGAASVPINPLPAGAAGAAGVLEAPTFETFTDFEFILSCTSNPEVQLHFDRNSVFDGVLTRPQGAEPFVDCGGKPGVFDPGIDQYADLNENGEFDGDPNNPRGLEPFDDANGNSFFDAIWMGGFDNGRAANGIDEASPLVATAMVISKGFEFTVIVTLDSIGNVSTHLNGLRQRIADELGLDGSSIVSPDVQHIIVSSLHDHQAPDTLGLWGPTAFTLPTVQAAVSAGLLSEDDLGPFGGVPARIGINFPYRNWVDDQAVRAVQQAVEDLRRAEIRVATATAPMRPDAEVLNPDAADQTESFVVERSDEFLMTDIRWPYIRDPEILAFQAVDTDSGNPIATLVNWTNHVEAMGSETNLLSADYAGYLRQRLETVFGGTGIYIVGTVGGLQTPLRDSFVPIVDADGNLHRTDGSTVPFADLYAPVFAGTGTVAAVVSELAATAQRSTNSSPQKAASLGRIVAEVAIGALQHVEPFDPVAFQVRAREVLVPIENPGFILLAQLGGLEGREVLVKGETDPGFVSDRPDQCGLSGCIRETITLVDFGDFQFLTTPGELLPEYTIGRPRVGVPQDRELRFVRKAGDGSILDDFGVNEFRPITGLRTLRPGRPLFIFGLAQSELGYFIPQSDFVNVFEGLLPRPEDVDDEIGDLADLDLVFLLGLQANPGFEEGEELSLREIIETSWEKFPEERYPETSLGGVSLVDIPGVSLDNHPNTAGNDNSVGPRTGEIVYNAMCDLLDDGTRNDSCPNKLPVEDDPNFLED